MPDVALQINTLGSSAARGRYRERWCTIWSSIWTSWTRSSRRLHTNPLRVLDSKNPALQETDRGAPKLADYLDEESRKHFEGFRCSLRDAGIPYLINPKLVRGLDYYNWTVFEWVTDQLGAQGTVCAGGRYDGLVEQIGGKPTPACGFAMGVERLLALLEECAFQAPRVAPDVYLVHQGEAANKFAMAAAEQLRDQGLHVLLHCGGGSFKSQMKKADASGARYAVIIGDDEAGAGEVSLKPLRELGEQMRVALESVVSWVRQ